MASKPRTSRQGERRVSTDHEGFLRHAAFRWLKAALWLCLASIVGYVLADIKPRPSGGSWYGYTLGTIGAGLIVWLALLGIRKRRMSPGGWSLKAWTSAHVYLGLALIVVATLHTGFQLGWNVHTLAYGLMIVVILSGLFGVVAYATLPAALSANREEMTQAQMIDGIESLDRQLDAAAQPLVGDLAALVLAAISEDPFRQGLIRRLSGRYDDGATEQAITVFDSMAARSSDPALARVEALLRRRKAQLDRLRRHLRYKALLEIWLHLHVPATIALLAALTAHIVSVFYYW
jgi:hypothetical protein